MSQTNHHGLFSLDAEGRYLPATGEAIVVAARACMTALLVRGAKADSPGLVQNYLTAKLGLLPYEVFAVVFLDAQHGIIECREMFRGTLTQTSVYPREVVREALELHAAAVILAHNHPSGAAEPSRADEYLTQTLIKTLQLVDVRVLDHIVVAGGTTVSFAERGLL